MKNIQKALCLMLVLCLTFVAGAALAQDYTATEKGFGGDVTVTLTIENNEIVAAKAQARPTASAPRRLRTCLPRWLSRTA